MLFSGLCALDYTHLLKNNFSVNDKTRIFVFRIITLNECNMNKLIILFIGICMSCTTTAQNIQLPAPDRAGGKSLMAVLNERKSTRSFQDRELSHQQLADLLWAANGFNREDKRTAPTANNRQELEFYVALKSGLYFYDAKANVLILIKKGDYRKDTGTQDYVGTAPLNIIFVYDTEKASSERYAYTDCGFISQNIYLYCASAGLGTVVRGSFNKDELAKLLQLKSNQQVLLTQSVGFAQ